MIFKAMKLDELMQGVSKYEKERGPRTDTWDTATSRVHLKEEDFAKDIKKWPVMLAGDQKYLLTSKLSKKSFKKGK